jgi:competence protein ComEC
LTVEQAQGRLELTFLDVGQGDAIVIRFPDASIWVVDAGGTRLDESDEESGPRFDIGEAVVSRYLWHEWTRRLHLLVVSHPHMDHGGGMPALIRNFRTGAIVCNGDSEEAVKRRILVAAAKRMVPVMTLTSVCDTRVGGVHVRVLSAPQDGRSRSDNDSSLVLKLSYGRFSALLTGDIERASETEMTARWQGGIRSDLLKVAHHGSRTSTSEMFLNQVRPRWAVISAGRNNPFGEPAREVVLRLARRGILPLLTMDQGAITLTTDGERYTLRSFIGGDLESGILP